MTVVAAAGQGSASGTRVRMVAIGRRMVANSLVRQGLWQAFWVAASDSAT